MPSAFDSPPASDRAVAATKEEGEPPPGRAKGLEIDLAGLEEGWDALPDAAGHITAAVAALASHPALAAELPAQACIALSSDAEVRALNRDWRGKDRPTNVLSFPAADGSAQELGAPRFIGDVVLARETILAEARELGIPAAHHLQHLTVHGLLHLLGFDHEDDGMAQDMEALETAILATLGVPDPYAAQTTTP